MAYESVVWYAPSAREGVVPSAKQMGNIDRALVDYESRIAALESSTLLNYPVAVTAGTPLANSNTLTDISAAPNYTLGANRLVAGSVLEFTAFGVFSTTGTPTLRIGVYYGAVAGLALVPYTATTGSGVTDVPWRLEVTMIVRTVGASGTAICQGKWNIGTTSSAWGTVPLPGTTLATVTLDTTTAKALTVGAIWGAADPANTVTCHGFLIKKGGLGS